MGKNTAGSDIILKCKFPCGTAQTSRHSRTWQRVEVKRTWKNSSDVCCGVWAAYTQTQTHTYTHHVHTKVTQI